MPLNVAGVVAGQIIHATDVHQFADLLTGTMNDQAITILNTMALGGGSESTSAVKLSLIGIPGQTGAMLRGLLASGDTNPAWQIDKAGTISWGAGGASALDNTLSRLGSTLMGFSQQLQVGGLVNLTQVTTPGPPAAGLTAFYSKMDGNLYYRPSGGAETLLQSSGAGSGTVTSVAMTLPTALFVSPPSGSPVTTAGTLAVALASQTQNLVLASPDGSSGTPTMRAIVNGDLPTVPNQLGTQSANVVFAGPTTGAAANPTFRALVGADLGSGSADSSHFLRGDLTWATLPSTSKMFFAGALGVGVGGLAGGLGAGITACMPLNGQFYGDVTTSVSHTEADTAMPDGGTFKNLFVWVGQNQPGDGNATVTLMKNGSAQTLTVTVSASATAGTTVSDTSHSFSVAQGDAVSVRVVNNSPGSEGAFVNWAVEFDPS